MVVSETGLPLRAFPDKDGIWRYPTSPQTVSPRYIEALLSYEDRHFYRHPGVNPAALVRAAWQWSRSGRIVSGGSTLTMQVARLLHPHSRTVAGKLHQIFRAFQLEVRYSKKEILELYLNLAPFGGNIEGVEAASWRFFGKSASDLSHGEAALLAVLPQSPSRIRPDRWPDRAKAARDKLARRMGSLGVWPEEIVREVVTEPIFVETENAPLLAPLLSRRLISKFPKAQQLPTFIDADLQFALQDHLTTFVEPLAPGTSAAVLIIENDGLKVRAHAGTAAFAKEGRNGYIDMTRAVRSPGSLLKPFLYGMAMDDGLIHSASLLVDAPRLAADYRPANFNRGFSGPVSVATALRRSLNIPAVQVMEAVTPRRFAARLLATGASLSIPENRPNPAMILGGVGMKMEETAALFASLANGGKVAPLRYSPLEAETSPKPFLSPEAAWVILEILRDRQRPDRPLSSASTGWENPIGWKTGTSYGFRDAWAMGVSKKYTIAVWVGRPDGTPLPGQYGSLTATPLLFTLSDWMHQNLSSATFRIPKPEAVETATITWPLGIRKKNTPPSMRHMEKTAFLMDGVVPPTLSTEKTPSGIRTFFVDPETGLRVGPRCQKTRVPVKIALWPRALDPFLPDRFRRNGLLPRRDPDCPEQDGERSEIRISGIEDGATLKAAQNGMLPALEVHPLGAVETVFWFLDGKKVAKTDPGDSAIFRFDSPGVHQLIALDALGRSDRVSFQVTPF